MDSNIFKDVLGAYWRTKAMLVGVCLLALVAGISSRFLWGEDNLVEEIAENILEDELHLPQGTIHLGPHTTTVIIDIPVK